MRGAIPQRSCPFFFLLKERTRAGEWNGNGGQMVVATKRSISARKTRGTGQKAKSPRSTKLSIAANKTVGKNCAIVARKLLERILQGDIQSAKLLVTLADSQPEDEDAGKEQRFHSVAKQLAAEPEWSAEKLGEDAASVET